MRLCPRWLALAAIVFGSTLSTPQRHSYASRPLRLLKFKISWLGASRKFPGDVHSHAIAGVPVGENLPRTGNKLKMARSYRRPGKAWAYEKPPIEFEKQMAGDNVRLWPYFFGLDGNPTKEFVGIMSEIFDQHDLDGDGALSDSEFILFLKNANEEGKLIPSGFYDECLTRLESNEKGLTKKGLIDLFVLQASINAEETFEDITRLGYGDRLSCIVEDDKAPEDWLAHLTRTEFPDGDDKNTLF
ncbi:hypothetical protein AAMO2058_000953800 [Amorphochlora amoebiformis]